MKASLFLTETGNLTLELFFVLLAFRISSQIHYFDMNKNRCSMWEIHCMFTMIYYSLFTICNWKKKSRKKFIKWILLTISLILNSSFLSIVFLFITSWCLYNLGHLLVFNSMLNADGQSIQTQSTWNIGTIQFFYLISVCIKSWLNIVCFFFLTDHH